MTAKFLSHPTVWLSRGRSVHISSVHACQRQNQHGFTSGIKSDPVGMSATDEMTMIRPIDDLETQYEIDSSQSVLALSRKYYVTSCFQKSRIKELIMSDVEVCIKQKRIHLRL